MVVPSHVMILGCGRSGTSIFGELFDHLPQYSYYSEPPFEALASLDYTHPVAVKVPKESNAFPADPGLSFPLRSLWQIVPSPRQIFWQVRHPLDTICSLKVGISRNWGHHPKPPDWQQWLSRPLVERCAHHWTYLNSVGYAQVADRAEVTRFEVMLDDPLAFAIAVGNTIGLDTEEHATFLQQWADRVRNEPHPRMVEARTSQAYSTQDHSVKVGRWKENLTEEEVALVLPIVVDTAHRFGYDLQREVMG